MRRYDDKADGGMLESEGGYWVKHADHLAELSRLQLEVEQCHKTFGAESDRLGAIVARLKARVEMLEGALDFLVRRARMASNELEFGGDYETARTRLAEAIERALAALPASAPSEGEGHV